MVVPTYNGGDLWEHSAESIRKYFGGTVLVIDSGSRDETVKIAKSKGFKVISITANDFNHGGTRNLGLEHVSSNSDVVFFMTQDAILTDELSMNNIVAMFDLDHNLAAVYGKQIPHDNANVIAQHARYYNYSNNGYNVSRESGKALGLKAVFMSNSFAAYRVSIFMELGGFAKNTILCEDMLYAATALTAGYHIGYAANATVKHSHNYSAVDEFKRYFDIGVFHATEKWIAEDFGGAGGEGKRYIMSELKYILKKAPLWLPVCIINDFAKICGYKLGKKYRSLPSQWIKCFSMHRKYWE